MVEIGTMHIDNAIGGIIDVMLQDISTFSVSSNALHSNSITTELASIKNKVQNPLVGLISQPNWLWEPWEILLQGLDENFTRKQVLAQYCLISMNWVDDFI